MLEEKLAQRRKRRLEQLEQRQVDETKVLVYYVDVIDLHRFDRPTCNSHQPQTEMSWFLNMHMIYIYP